jgi:hypothetical protein
MQIAEGLVNSALLVELHPTVAGTTASSSWTVPCGVVMCRCGLNGESSRGAVLENRSREGTGVFSQRPAVPRVSTSSGLSMLP